MSKIHEIKPTTCVDTSQKGSMLIEERRFAVIQSQRLPVLGSPGSLACNSQFIDGELAELTCRSDRNGEPTPALSRANLVPIDEAVLFELNMVEHNVCVGNCNAMKVTEPGEVCRLIDG